MNATADDWESIDQIHEHVARAGLLATRDEVADEMLRLLRSGRFEVMPQSPIPVDAVAVLGAPTKYWMAMSQTGRAQWQRECARMD